MKTGTDSKCTTCDGSGMGPGDYGGERECPECGTMTTNETNPRPTPETDKVAWMPVTDAMLAERAQLINY